MAEKDTPWADVRAPRDPADPERLRRHVAALASEPRSRRHAPRAMERAEEYVAGQQSGPSVGLGLET